MNKELLSVHLAELKFVHEQMHARMAVVSRLITLSVTFYVVMLTSFFLKLDAIFSANYGWLLLLAIIPFFVIAMLIAREDFLMLNHDKYFYTQLRPAILEASGDNKDSNTLMFLEGMPDCKVGAITSVASVFRYAFPLFGMGTLGLIGLMKANENIFGYSTFFAAVITFLVTMFVFFRIYIEQAR